MGILIDGVDKNDPSIPDYDEAILCTEHPDAVPASGFGLAGGGFGPYTVCEECCKILSKTVLPPDAC